MKLSDIIEKMILDMLTLSDGTAQIRRNELASNIGCAPSQINYVIHTRFNEQSGYIVESRRGGGGCIIIRRIQLENRLQYIINSTSSELSYQDVLLILKSLKNNNLISEREMSLIKTASSDMFLPNMQPQKNRMRAVIFKNMIASLCTKND